jgi:hypothetical protein
MMKLTLNVRELYFTMEFPIRDPKIAHGVETKSSAACALPLCLFGTISAIAASLFLMLAYE